LPGLWARSLLTVELWRRLNSRWADPGMACCCARRGLDTPQTQGGGLRFVGLIYFWGGTKATTDIIFRLNPEEN